MTHPNQNVLWAETLVDELVAGGVDAVCLAPGSRSTPLAVAFATHEDVTVFSHLDERSAAFFALGRSKQTGTPTPVVCTSGTAAANFHPAVLEASEGRVPLLLLTADRPPELHESGANQTTDQQKLYGDAVRWDRSLPEPGTAARTLRALRVTVGRALLETTTEPHGPVHLNVPFRKPLEPIEIPESIPEDLAERAPLGSSGRDGPFVQSSRGTVEPDPEAIKSVRTAVKETSRGLIVCGPSDAPVPGPAALELLVEVTGFPALADPLSGHRFGDHIIDLPICGGYDSYLDGEVPWAKPDLVLRFGASPTSKQLRNFLGDSHARQFLIDPAGEWREATFTTSDLVVSNPDAFCTAVAECIEVDREGGVVDSNNTTYRNTFESVERRYWEVLEEKIGDTLFEGSIAATVAENCPSGSTLFVSNSMPVRDLDRFGQPREIDLRTLGNRGVSGIDGVTSTALGAGSATDGDLVLLIGDLAFYHDMNGLLALERCGVDATIVVVQNDGGGIFHQLPIEEFDPPFTEYFKTPHGLSFEPLAELYGFDFERIESLDGLKYSFDRSFETDGTTVLSVHVNAESSHRFREKLHETVRGERDRIVSDRSP